MNPGTPSVFAEIAPFRIEPKFVSRVWGFTDLNPWYPFHSSGDPVGEVWLTGDECKVASGPHAGTSLAQLFRNAPKAMLGSAAPEAASPLLIKVIFAREKLSVQVHPDDALAQKFGHPRGKTECWYALAAEKGAQVAVGLRQGVTLDQVKASVHDGTMESLLSVVPVTKDDMIFVDAGTVHAIWPGSILLETQQNCDLTYRLYDYGRPRELQIEKSLEATRLVTRAGKVEPREGEDRTVLLDDEYFCIERIPVLVSRSSASLRGTTERARGLSYLFAAAGSARLTSPGFEAVDLPEHGIVAVPAMSPVFAVQDLDGLDLIRITPRWPGSVA
ncbi:MAG: type I phosphomannose isomerase catalytic subunit [Terracidiphilus sp.]